jgi:hypothetical protein
VATGAVVPLDAACHTVRAVPAPDLSATDPTDPPKVAIGAPAGLRMPDANPASHHPVMPAINAKPDGEAEPNGAANIGRPGAAMTVFPAVPERITLMG